MKSLLDSLDAHLAVQIDREARRRQKEADAALMEAADCPCADLARLNEIEFDGPVYDWGVSLDYRTDPPVVTKHAACCPIALAEQLRRQQ